MEAAGLFEFADLGLSDDSSELSDPPDSIVSGETDEEDKDEVEWFELSSGSEDDEDEEGYLGVVMTECLVV
jgi:hypothetical protein